jgi:hypothetical protein
MKTILICFVCVNPLFLSSQTLTQVFNEPQAGDREYIYNLDTTAFASGLPASTGSAAVWDFSSVTAKAPIMTNSFVAPSAVAESSMFPGVTFVQQTNILNTHCKSTTTPTTQTELVGLTSSTLTLNLSNSAIIAKYPMEFGSGSTDNLAGTFTALGFNGSCSGKITTTCNGSGTLNLPDGIKLSNVLRVQSTQTMALTTGGIFALATIKEVIINYYHPSLRFPVVSVNYTTITPSTGSAIDTKVVSGSTAFFVTGIPDQGLTEFNIFPNPCKDAFTISADRRLGLRKINVFSLAGEKVYSGENTNEVNLAGLAPGVYLVSLETATGTACRRLVKE